GRVPGWTLAPKLINEALAANDLVGSEHEQREQRATLRAGDLDRLSIVPNLERTKEPKLHASATLTPPTAGENPWKRPCQTHETPVRAKSVTHLPELARRPEQEGTDATQKVVRDGIDHRRGSTGIGRNSRVGLRQWSGTGSCLWRWPYSSRKLHRRIDP